LNTECTTEKKSLEDQIEEQKHIKKEQTDRTKKYKKEINV